MHTRCEIDKQTKTKSTEICIYFFHVGRYSKIKAYTQNMRMHWFEVWQVVLIT